MKLPLSVLVVACIGLVACAQGVSDPIPPPINEASDAGKALPLFPTPLKPPACGYVLNGKVCENMINFDHLDIPNTIWAEYSVECPRPADGCIMWSIQDSCEGKDPPPDCGPSYPQDWAWCCPPPPIPPPPR